jgi:hypothetical protein
MKNCSRLLVIAMLIAIVHCAAIEESDLPDAPLTEAQVFFNQVPEDRKFALQRNPIPSRVVCCPQDEIPLHLARQFSSFQAKLGTNNDISNLHSSLSSVGFMSEMNVDNYVRMQHKRTGNCFRLMPQFPWGI